jgi:Holliday junction resolvase RusA-like endonuclease
MILSFFLDIDPPTRTAQQKGASVIGGHVHHYVKPEVRAAQEILRAALRPYAPDKPLDGPLSLNCFWYFTSKSHKPGTWRTTRPDTDNLQKGLKDCMTAEGFWHDDSQVVIECCSKRWDSRPGIRIELMTLEEMTP